MGTISLEVLPYEPQRVFEKPLAELTQSSIASFLGCPQRFAFRYLYLLKTRGISIPLVVGSAVHKGLEILIDPKRKGMDILLHKAQVEAGIDSVFDRVTEDSLNMLGMEEQLEQGRAQAHALVEAWHLMFHEYYKDWRFLKTEMKVRAAPGATHLSPLFDRMAGMIDGVIMDPEGKVWILEHKTRRTMHGLNINSLSLNHQALWYMILCKYKLQQEGMPAELMPKGFMYDAMMKPQHRINAKGWKDCKDRMLAAICDDPDKYFSLSPIEVSEETVDKAWANFQRIIKAMDNLSPENIYLNTNACDDYGGCPYKPLCQSGAEAARPETVFGSPEINLYEIAQPHTELEDDGDIEKWAG